MLSRKVDECKPLVSVSLWLFYIVARIGSRGGPAGAGTTGRGFHSSTSSLNMPPIFVTDTLQCPNVSRT
jgi:hypothetical protein